MANYAFLNMDNVVTSIIHGRDELDTDINWELWYQNERTQVCKRFSYNMHGGVHSANKTPFRKNKAIVGSKYDESRNAFLYPKPFDSWTLNETTCLWEAPIAMPADGAPYDWDEDNQQWIELT